ncbi:hypothetical protein A4G20_05845 [Pasteurellaceae bacterium RH1A]|nr:hypothetical protein A4G20_05845 [Pasteurellaceae bacterium RH1A]
MLYPIAFQKVSDGYVVAVPDISGCFSAGNTLEEAFANTKEAITSHLELLVRDGEEVPKPTSIESHQDNPDYADTVFSVVDVDITHLLGKAERINITMPGYLIKRIDEFVAVHKEYKNRSSFLSKIAADKILAA